MPSKRVEERLSGIGLQVTIILMPDYLSNYKIDDVLYRYSLFPEGEGY